MQETVGDREFIYSHETQQDALWLDVTLNHELDQKALIYYG